MSPAPLEWSILGPPFLAGVVVLATHVPLGRRVLARGIIFLDLAVAQIAALGGLGATLVFAPVSEWVVQGGAGTSALLGAAALFWTERRWPDLQEAIIGSVFVLAASGGMLVLAGNPHGGEHLRDLLAGQILWVTLDRVSPMALFSLSLLGVWGLLGRRWPDLGFYIVFALAVTASVQLVGVYLVFASLILPALAGVRCPGSAGLVLGFVAGCLGYGAGLVVSGAFDLPSGPTCVWALAVAALVIRSGHWWLGGAHRSVARDCE